jgi:hypothetical protein
MSKKYFTLQKCPFKKTFPEFLLHSRTIVYNRYLCAGGGKEGNGTSEARLLNPKF